ncbi:OmpA family protein [Teredinibacter waterburyi]|uniref:OmpA family protein n=1 Tax=Teredinibacter waterburyi TaxID=1500538 RepID=UPI00165FCF38|nr:OmpA family protein [Teredinibacter waterburyi]
MNKLLVAGLVFSLGAGLGGCATDPYTGEEEVSKTATGAGIGALAGAVIGAATASKNDRDKAILTGAAAGAAVGGGAGYYMDQQESKLRKELAGTGVQVKREGNDLRLIMPGNITFATGAYNIREDFLPVLSSVGKVLKEFSKTRIMVSGHTDSVGSESSNQKLSELRAASVRDYLLEKNISASRVKAAGYGESSPIASNDSAEGRQANRRVELKLEPTE